MEASRYPLNLTPPKVSRVGFFPDDAGGTLVGPLAFDESGAVSVAGFKVTDLIRVRHGDLRRETPGGDAVFYDNAEVVLRLF